MLHFSPTPLWLVAIWRGVECPGVLLVLVLGLGGLTLDSAHVRQLEHLPTQRGSAGFKPWNIFHKICKYFSAICRCRMCRSFKTRTAPSSLPCWLMYPGGDDGGGSICVYSALYSARQMSRSRPTDNLPHYSNYQSQASLATWTHGNLLYVSSAWLAVECQSKIGHVSDVWHWIVVYNWQYYIMMTLL